MSCFCCGTEQVKDEISSARVAGVAVMALKQLQYVSASLRSSPQLSRNDNSSRMEEATNLILRALLCGLRLQGKGVSPNASAAQHDELGSQALLSLVKGLPLDHIQLPQSGATLPVGLLITISALLGRHSSCVHRWQWVITVLIVHGALGTFLGQIGARTPGSDGQAAPTRMTAITRALLRAYSPGSILITPGEAARLASYVADMEAAAMAAHKPRGYLDWMPQPNWSPVIVKAQVLQQESTDTQLDLLVLRALAPVLAVCRPGAVEPHVLDSIYRASSIDIPDLPAGTLSICYSYLGYDSVLQLEAAAARKGIPSQEAIAALRFLLDDPFCRQRLQHIVLRVHGSPSAVAAWTLLDHQLRYGCSVPISIGHPEKESADHHQAQGITRELDSAALGDATPYSIGTGLLSALQAVSGTTTAAVGSTATVIVKGQVVQTGATQTSNALRQGSALKGAAVYARACLCLFAVDDRLRCTPSPPSSFNSLDVEAMTKKISTELAALREAARIIEQAYDIDSDLSVSVPLRVWEACEGVLDARTGQAGEAHHSTSTDNGGLTLRQASEGHEWHTSMPVEASAVHISNSGGLSRLLTPDLMLSLRNSLPKAEHSLAWYRAYSMTRDGASLTGMIKKVQEAQASGVCSSKYSLLVIKDAHDGVFGCVTACPWATLLQGAGRALKAVHETYVFTAEDRSKEGLTRSLMAADRQVISKVAELAGHARSIGWRGPMPAVKAQVDGAGAEGHVALHIYPVCAHSSSTTPLFLSVDKSSTPSRLDVGLGGTAHTSTALSLQGGMEQGQSGPCETFLSPPLCSLRSRVVSGNPASPVPPGSVPTLAHLGPVVQYTVLDVEVWTSVRRDVSSDLAVHGLS